jgi:probable RNA-binding protein EIF1AD
VEREVQASDDGDAPKVQATLAHYLYRDQIRHLQNRKLWPPEFDQGDAEVSSTGDQYGAGELRANTNHDFRELPATTEEGEDRDSESEEEPAVDALGNTIVRGESSDDGEGKSQSR